MDISEPLRSRLSITAEYSQTLLSSDRMTLCEASGAVSIFHGDHVIRLL